jgi:sortase A
MLSDRIIPALASVGLGCSLLFTAGFAREVHPGIAGPLAIGSARAGAPPRIESGELVARLTVSRIALDSPVFEGVEARSLARGAGHLSGTGLPGEEGQNNPCVIAIARGERGAAVAALRLGDRVRFTTSLGPRSYRVTERRVMEPTAFRPGPASSARVTLLTPFPSDSPGPAPMRLAVALERLPD